MSLLSLPPPTDLLHLPHRLKKKKEPFSSESAVFSQGRWRRGVLSMRVHRSLACQLPSLLFFSCDLFQEFMYS